MKYVKYIEYISKRLEYRIQSIFIKDFEEINNHIFIFSDPRSGSTWMAEMLKSLFNQVIIDEPFHLAHNKKLQMLHWGWNQIIPEDAKWPEAENYIHYILNNKNLGYSQMSLNSYSKIRRAKYGVYKIIRGKGFLPWFIKHINPNRKPIFLIRNPFAAISSMINHESWNYPFTKFSLPKSPFTNIYHEHLPFLQSLQTKEEQLAAFWSIGNKICLSHQDHGKKWMVVKYEDLVTYPRHELNRIGVEYNLQIPDNIKVLSQRPSSTSKRIDFTNTDFINDWKTKLSKTQITKIEAVLEYFELYYPL